MGARVHALVGDSDSEILEFKDLSINLKTYEAKAGDVLLDLTFREYELLKFFVINQEINLLTFRKQKLKILSAAVKTVIQTHYKLK